MADSRRILTAAAFSLFLVWLSGCDSQLIRELLRPGSVPNSTGQAIGNSNPVIISYTANPSNLTTPGGTITFQIDAVDKDGDTLKYSWSATGGTLSTTTGRVVSWKPPAEAGGYSILVSVSDGKGGSAEGAQNITVTAEGTATVNAQPTPVSTTVAPTSYATPTANMTPLPDLPPTNVATFAKITTPIRVSDASFPSFNEGWAVGGDGQVIHTVDTGRTWTKTKLSGTFFNTVWAQTNSHVWVAGQDGQLWRTQNAGETWDLIDVGANHEITDITFVNLSDGYYTTKYKGVFATKDGGASWFSIRNNSGSFNLPRLTAIPEGTVWGFGWNSNFSIWQDGGWSDFQVGASFQQLAFRNDLEGYARGGKLYKSVDGGFNWTTIGTYRTPDKIYREPYVMGFLWNEQGDLLVSLSDATLFSIDGQSWTTAGESIGSISDGRIFGQGKAWILADGGLVRWGR